MVRCSSANVAAVQAGGGLETHVVVAGVVVLAEPGLGDGREQRLALLLHVCKGKASVSKELLG